MLDFVQVVSDHVCKERRPRRGLASTGSAWRSASRSINAIKHGNQNDAGKKRVRRVRTATFGDVPELTIRVRDQGEGFDPEEVADPLAPENLLKGSGRGIFLIRSFMDEVRAAACSGRRHGDAHGQARPARRRPRHHALKPPAPAADVTQSACSSPPRSKPSSAPATS